MNILLTGGTGYIGSHTALTLIEAGHSIVLYDNLSNSNKNVVDRINKITNSKVPFVKGDVRDTDLLIKTFKSHKIEAAIHFAGLKAVGESVSKPIDYYANNVQGTISLLQAMQKTNVKTLVFSSSATVYGDPKYLPIDEDHPLKATSPYGQTKLHIEEILKDLAKSDDNWRITCLRYFNPVGAHESGLIGENPNDTPNNLMPYITRVASGEKPHLEVFGNDYKTKDGTGVRDYIHVMDVSEGHIAALIYLQRTPLSFSVFNLGAGKGLSVLEIVKAFEDVNKKEIKYKITQRRLGDVATCYADVKKAKEILNWEAKRDLNDMCTSAWKFQSLLKTENY